MRSRVGFRPLPWPSWSSMVRGLASTQARLCLSEFPVIRPLTHTRRPIPASLVVTISRDTPKVTS